MNAVQFLRLADRLASLPEPVRRIVAAMAEGRAADAAAAADGKGSPDWWAAEFFLTQLSDHGVSLPSTRKAEPARALALFAD